MINIVRSSGYTWRPTPIMPQYVCVDIADVVTYNDKVTIVYFSDGSFEKAVCTDNDTFDIETGITICLCKKMLKDLGGPTLSHLLRCAKHAIKDREEYLAYLEEEKEIMKRRKAKAERNRQRRAERRIMRIAEAIQKLSSEANGDV